MKPGRMIPGGMNMQAMMKQAQKLQADMMKKQEELEKMEFTASAGGGVVTATVVSKQITALTIKPEAVDPDDVEMLEDLIMAAINDGYAKADKVYEEKMGKFGNMGGLGGLL